MTRLRFRFLLSTFVIGSALFAACSSGESTTDTTADTVASSTSMADPASTSTSAAEDAVARISVTVGVDSGPDRVEEVALGQEVALTLTNPDADDEFHLHGYDLGGGETAKGESKTFTFTATEAGEFELESHVTGDVLVVVKVS